LRERLIALEQRVGRRQSFLEWSLGVAEPKRGIWREGEWEMVPVTEVFPDSPEADSVHRPFDPMSLRDDYEWY
jgi:hypothetical protein